MKNLIVILIVAFIYVFSGCYKCKNIDYCPPPDSAVTYFGAYAEGAYWIYYNQDSTKIDSVYITDYEMKREGESTVKCISWDAKTFLLNSDFIIDNSIEVKISNGGYCERNHAIFTFTLPINYRICIATENENVLQDGCGTTHEIKLLEKYQLKNNTIIYENVIQYDDRYWFAEEIGLIKYITHDNFDTFYVHQYKIQ